MSEIANDEEVRSLMNAIQRRYGLDFTNYETKSLKRGISRLMMKRKINNILELWSIILKDEKFFMESIDDLMVNLTELFRNPEAWEMVRDNVLENYKVKPSLKVWHAGCSTGEEVYTMAIILDELNMLKKTSALATDLSIKVLSIEKKVYSLMTMKNYMKPFLKFYPEKTIKNFFDYNDTSATIKKNYKSHVDYVRHNLVQDPMDKKFDIIFCRNVMIYFDETLKMEVLNKFNNSLNEGGFLIIGYYDTLPNRATDIFDIHDSKTRIYKKKSLLN